MPAKLFVGNLSFQATEEDLRELFQQAGTVESVRIVTDQFTGRPRGFGFVEMATKEEAAKAVEMLNGRLFRDRNLVVDEARPQPQRGAGGGGREWGGGSGPRPSSVFRLLPSAFRFAGSEPTEGRRAVVEGGHPDHDVPALPRHLILGAGQRQSQAEAFKADACSQVCGLGRF